MVPISLTERRLPPLPPIDPGNWPKTRRRLLEILSENEYGFSPPAPDRVDLKTEKTREDFAGKGSMERWEISLDTPKGPFSFPARFIRPNVPEKPPVFVHISFRPPNADEFFPAEELIDLGVAVAQFGYNDIVPDHRDGLSFGMAALYPRSGSAAWGAIGMWAFAASRVLDALRMRDDVDLGRAAVVGHSRLGKTALWCAAQDERFAMAVSNDSGCSGAALSHGRSPQGEHIDHIVQNFPHWFCPEYQRFAGRDEELPFDQHFLLAAIAPRFVAVGSAEDDAWADPASEFAACQAAAPAFEALGVSGFIGPAALPQAPARCEGGRIAYHIRKGSHDLSRADWAVYAELIKGL